MTDMKTGVRAVMAQLAAQREAPVIAAKPTRGWRCHANGCPMPSETASGMCQFHHEADGDSFQSVTTDLRRLEWLWNLWANLCNVDNFKSWRVIAERAMRGPKGDIDMVPTAADRSRELYLYRLRRYVDYRMRLIDTKPAALVPHCEQPEFKKRHHHERATDEQH